MREGCLTPVSQLRYASITCLISDRFDLNPTKWWVSYRPSLMIRDWLVFSDWHCKNVVICSIGADELTAAMLQVGLDGDLLLNTSVWIAEGKSHSKTWVKCQMMSKLPPQSDDWWLTGILWIKHPHKPRCGNKMSELQLTRFLWMQVMLFGCYRFGTEGGAIATLRICRCLRTEFIRELSQFEQ